MKLYSLFALHIISALILTKSEVKAINFSKNSSIQAEEKDSAVIHDSTERKYLVVRSYRWYRRSYIFKDHKRLKVTTQQGSVMRGRLKIMDDSSFILYNTINSKLDTFRLSELYKINNVSLGSNIAAGVMGVGGIGLIGGGIQTISNNSNRFLYTFLGYLMIAGGGSISLSAIPLVNGKPLPNYRYAYIIYKTKGKKLRYWHLKRLIPM